jgi:hypothetical protein
MCSRLRQEGSAAVADHKLHPLFYLDTRDPSFRGQYDSWATDMLLQMGVTVAATEKVIARTKKLLIEADHILAQTICHQQMLELRRSKISSN